MKPTLIALSITTLLTACNSDYSPTEGQDAQGHSAPTAATAKANKKVGESLPLADQEDFENARRGLIASAESLQSIRQDNQRVVWNQDNYAFIKGDAPASVNPSLWRQAQLNGIHGLFKVTDGIYQLRGFDLANMTIIEGKTGWIVVDPLTGEQTARTAINFARKHLGEKPIRAVLFTHSHIDHFGGIEGIISAADTKAQNVRIIAPAGFLEEAVSENVMAGVAMQRRAGYMYGKRLARSPRGHVGTGLGKEPAFGSNISILEPTETVNKTGTELDIDGVKFIFQYAPASEAPAEFTFYLPEKKAFCGAEVVSRNLHNVYTLRGAKVRNALVWSNYIEEARKLFGQADIYFASHHWPLWGRDKVNEFLKKQRDIYKYIHDQTVRLANNGYTPREIAEQLTLPKSLHNNFATRGYYGTLKHNSKAVYTWYFGFYDGNPATLDALPPADAGKKYVALAGGAAALVDNAQTAFDNGEYRWAAELLSHLVFAEPDHDAGKNLLANTFDQLGYQAESAPWRDVYLSAAYELRHGGPEEGVNMADALGLLREIPINQFLDSMAARLNGPEAEGKDLRVKMVFTDLNEAHLLWLENAVLHHEPATQNTEADATLTLTHELFLKMVMGQAGVKDTLFSDDLEIDGSVLDLVGFFSLLDKPDGKFNIVVP